MLASIQTFQDMKITKFEYDENGDNKSSLIKKKLL
jgi:actin-related protein